jgi:large subunit ribosomal protein L21e
VIGVCKMIKRKNIRNHGKIKLSEYFQGFNEKDRVTVVRELALMPKFPKRLQGRSGIVDGKRGKSYLVKIKDLNKEKSYLIHPVHLRRLK